MFPSEKILILFIFIIPSLLADDFYELLGISKSADTKSIRKAFKKLAVIKHPDKNTDDPKAHDEFLKINRAYEVLKDAEKRKKYDAYGEEGLKDDHPSNTYQSWHFYQEEFGMYDDDKEIITLDMADYEQAVQGTDDIWFVNFYSPHCGHCHDLAPSWREIARQLQGVIRVGAVNCEDEWMLCQNLGIHGFPTLMIYPLNEHYNGERNTEAMVEFIMNMMQSKIHELSDYNYKSIFEEEKMKGMASVISFCGEGGDCMSKETAIKVAAMLDEVITVANADCHTSTNLCKDLGQNYGTFLYPAGQVSKGNEKSINTLDAKEIVSIVLQYLPDVNILDEQKFKKFRGALKYKLGKPWMVLFVNSDSSDLELRKLPAMLDPVIDVGRIDCRSMSAVCDEMYIKKFPSFVLFKSGGGYEIHHGRKTAHDIAAFARDSAQTSVEVLGPGDFPDRVVQNGDPWFVDFYAPWCPPCMKLLPEFRKAAKSSDVNVNFGTVDCTIHTSLCRSYDVKSYPTTIFYNKTIPHQYKGRHSANRIVEFIKDMLNPPMVILTPDTFASLVSKRGPKDIWLVDFFAPWCGPCQELAPEWRRLAKMVKTMKNVLVGQVDCAAHKALCQKHNVGSYPTIRLYPMGQTGARSFHDYNDWFRDANSIRQWIFSFLPKLVKTLTPNMATEAVRSSNEPWLIDFYAPWCRPCQMFAPEFERIANGFSEKINLGTIDCQQYSWFCEQSMVHGYPTVRYYSGGGNQDISQGEELEIDAEYIISFIRHNVRDTLPKKIKNQHHDEL